MVTRFASVRPKLAVKKLLRFPQAGVCLVSGLQSICHTREGAISMIRILEYGLCKNMLLRNMVIKIYHDYTPED